MPALKINGHKIPLNFDDRLLWEDHVAHLENKLKSSLVAIKRKIKYIPKSQYMNIYNRLFISHLTYGIGAWEVYHTMSWKNYLRSKNVVLVSCFFEKVLIYSNNRNNRMVLNPNMKYNKLPATEQVL